MKKILSAFIICLTLIGCFDLFQPLYWSDDNYNVWESPGDGRLTLYYELDNNAGIGRVNGVSEIGANDNYIIVYTIEGYWILDKTKDDKYFNAADIVEGPFTLKEFNNRKSVLGIENLNFDKKLD